MNSHFPRLPFGFLLYQKRNISGEYTSIIIITM